MTSIVPITNQALANLGQKSFIQDINESSVEARYGKLFYEQSRKATLRAHNWNFAAGRKDLALLSGTAPDPWTYQYVLPAGCLKARYIRPTIPSIPDPFEIALSDDGTQRVLYTNKQDATLIYTVNVDNADLFDPLFVDALSYWLAARMAPVIAPTKSAEMLTRFMNCMRQAQAIDASEGEREDVSQTEWLEARVATPPELIIREAD